MAISDRRLRELAVQMAAVMDAIAPATEVQQSPQIKQQASANGMDAVTRESRIRWLRALRRALKYMDVELFFEQALVGKRDLDDLSDEEIIDLHRTIDRARDHFHNSDGVSYYEAGLLRRQEEVA